MSFQSSTTATAKLLRQSTMFGLPDIPGHHCMDFTSRDSQKTQFYVELEEKCKLRAAREVSELESKARNGEEDAEQFNDHEVQTVARVPRYLKKENISRIENYLSEYYMETVYQKLWEKAQNAVFGAEYMS